MRPRFDYIAARDIRVGTVFGFRAGDDMTADQVENLGLEVGVDVMPARTDVIGRPAGNANRGEWAKFALGQGLPVEEIDGMTRDELRDRFPADAEPSEPVDLTVDLQPDNAAEQVAEQTGRPTADIDGDEVPAGSVDEVLAWVDEDQTRAVMALVVERDRERPRVGVVEPLEKLVAPGE